MSQRSYKNSTANEWTEKENFIFLKRPPAQNSKQTKRTKKVTASRALELEIPRKRNIFDAVVKVIDISYQP